MINPDLPIHDMANRHSGLTPTIAANNLEALCVCLDRHHETPLVFDVVDDEKKTQAQIVWTAADERCLKAWNNEIDVTEAGACSCTLAAAELKRSLVAIYRAETGTGADYYIGPSGEQVKDLENCLRLEVSGINNATVAKVKQRLKEKVEQTRRGNSNIPALAAVVGFQCKMIAIETVTEIT